MGETNISLEQPKGGLSGGALKIIAILAMLIDHSALLISPEYYAPVGGVMHFIGRITGPMMFFFIAEGYRHTRNVNRYTLRLAAFAVLSYLPFVLFVNAGLPKAPGGWLRLNVIYTLLLGLLALRARHEVKNRIISWVLVGVCLAVSVLGDWGYFGVLAILMFDLLRGDLTRQRIGFCLMALLGGAMPWAEALLMGRTETPLTMLMGMLVSLGMLVPMGLLGLYNGQRGRGGKWLFYVFYPAHLLLLWLVGQALGLSWGL